MTDYELRPYGHPGKFEGGLVIDQIAYEASLAGCDDECGDTQEYGTWFGLLRGPFRSDGAFADVSATMQHDLALTKDELRFMASVAGVIVEEDSQGFVSVDWADSPNELEEKWDAIVNEYGDWAETHEDKVD